MRNLAVYFDANALAHDGQSPKLGYDRVAVHWKRGVFHPKTVFLLTEDPDSQGGETLVICCQSANITRAGWWENIECAHVEIVKDKSVAEQSCSFRNDLMALLVRIRRSMPNENHEALDAIHRFIRYRTNPVQDADTGRNGVRQPRLFGGSSQWSFPSWLAEEVAIPHEWNLEVISPYFDKANANALVQVLHASNPRQTRVYLPQHEDGTALVSEAVFNEVNSLSKVAWATLPTDITQRKATSSVEKLAPRFVHAKVYRFWKQRQNDLIIVGSINCTHPAHSKADRGNLEAGLLVEATGRSISRQWWLEELDHESMQFVEEVPDESDGNDQALFDVLVKYDWARHEVTVRLEGKLRFPIEFADMTDRQLFSLAEINEREWHVCDSSAAASVREAIQASSFLNVRCQGSSWRVLIREGSFSHRPSLLTELTPDEILKYWSLLTPDQRTAFLESRMVESVEGLTRPNSRLIDTTESVFHQFAGIFHAFGHLRRHLIECLEDERFTEAEYRMLGSKYDSLPELLRKMIEHEETDPLYVYVTFLTAKQLRTEIERRYSPFLSNRQAMFTDLDGLIAEGLQYRERFDFGGSDDGEQFLEWYESMFLRQFSW